MRTANDSLMIRDEDYMFQIDGHDLITHLNDPAKSLVGTNTNILRVNQANGQIVTVNWSNHEFIV